MGAFMGGFERGWVWNVSVRVICFEVAASQGITAKEGPPRSDKPLQLAQSLFLLKVGISKSVVAATSGIVEGGTHFTSSFNTPVVVR
jgi:hypothetical protein